MSTQFTVVKETPEFWLFNKPVGVSVNDNEAELGFIAQLKQHFNVTSAHPVHRLDKDTSGLLLVAKTESANKVLSQLFQNKAIQKTYLAITRYKQGSKPKKKQGLIKGDMQAGRNGSWMLLKTTVNPSETHFISTALGDRCRLCLLTPKTGKTHQLRVAMKSLSMPVLGDKRYTGEPADRMYLHAYSLEFTAFGEDHSYTCLPEFGERFKQAEFKDALAGLQSK